MCAGGFAGAVSVVVEMSIKGSKFPFFMFSVPSDQKDNSVPIPFLFFFFSGSFP